MTFPCLWLVRLRGEPQALLSLEFFTFPTQYLSDDSVHLSTAELFALSLALIHKGGGFHVLGLNIPHRQESVEDRILHMSPEDQHPSQSSCWLRSIKWARKGTVLEG